MPEQTELFEDVAAGRRLATEGAARAAAHADAVEPNWTQRAYEALWGFLNTDYANGSFSSYQVRWWAHEHGGLPLAPDDRAWGNVFSRARRAGRIDRAGYGASPDPIAHARPVSLWRRGWKR